MKSAITTSATRQVAKKPGNAKPSATSTKAGEPETRSESTRVITTSKGTTFAPGYTLDANGHNRLEDFTKVRNSVKAPTTWLKVYEEERNSVVRVAFGVTAEKINVGTQKEPVWKRMSKTDEDKAVRDHRMAIGFLIDEVREKYKDTSFKEIRVGDTSFSLSKDNVGQYIEKEYGTGVEPEGLDTDVCDKISMAVLKDLTKTRNFEGNVELSDYLTCRLKPKSPVKAPPKPPKSK
jgi:hypothetical protein